MPTRNRGIAPSSPQGAQAQRQWLPLVAIGFALGIVAAGGLPAAAAASNAHWVGVRVTVVLSMIGEQDVRVDIYIECVAYGASGDAWRGLMDLDSDGRVEPHEATAAERAHRHQWLQILSHRGPALQLDGGQPPRWQQVEVSFTNLTGEVTRAEPLLRSTHLSASFRLGPERAHTLHVRLDLLGSDSLWQVTAPVGYVILDYEGFLAESGGVGMQWVLGRPEGSSDLRIAFSALEIQETPWLAWPNIVLTLSVPVGGIASFIWLRWRRRKPPNRAARRAKTR